MSKRAEEVQASAILPESIISYAKEHAVLSGLVYREGVKFGYEQAEKETIERVIDWVRKNAYIYTDTQNDEEGNLMTVFLEKAFIDDLKKAMEEE